jgi:hypothetical protein
MSIPPKPAPRAPAIVAQVREAEALLADLEAETPRLALAKAEMQVGAHKAYTDHEIALSAARADLDAKIGAAEAAAELDRRAVAERIEMLRNADPDDLLDGISASDCCDGCSETECLLTGLPHCGHPSKGNLPPELMNDPVIVRLRSIARQTLIDLENDDNDEDD